MSSREINVVSKTQRIIVDIPTKSVAVISAGPQGPPGAIGPEGPAGEGGGGGGYDSFEFDASMLDDLVNGVDTGITLPPWSIIGVYGASMLSIDEPWDNPDADPYAWFAFNQEDAIQNVNGLSSGYAYLGPGSLDTPYSSDEKVKYAGYYLDQYPLYVGEDPVNIWVCVSDGVVSKASVTADHAPFLPAALTTTTKRNIYVQPSAEVSPANLVSFQVPSGTYTTGNDLADAINAAINQNIYSYLTIGAGDRFDKHYVASFDGSFIKIEAKHNGTLRNGDIMQGGVFADSPDGSTQALGWAGFHHPTGFGDTTIYQLAGGAYGGSPGSTVGHSRLLVGFFGS